MLVLNVLIALATFSTTLTAALFVILQMEKRRRKNYGVKDGDVPVLESQDRADAIVKNAAEKARAVLLTAEKEGVDLVAKYKQVEADIVIQYARQLDEITKTVHSNLLEKSRQAEKTYESGLANLQESVKQQIGQKEKEIQARVNEYFVSIEDSLKNYSTELKKRTQDVQVPFDQIKQELTQKISDSEKLYTDYLKGLEDKAGASLVSSEQALVQARQKAESGYQEAQEAYAGYLSGLKTKFDQIFEQNQKDMDSLKAGLGTKITQTEDSYAKFLKSLEDAMTADFNKKQQALEVKVNEFFEGSQELLNKFLKELEGRTQTQVEQEIGNAKKLIDEYQKQRLAIIDENLVAVLEKTLNITLGKKLTLADQTELVYEALEEAKKENFFAKAT